MNQQEFTETVLHHVCKMEREATREIRSSKRPLNEWFAILNAYILHGTAMLDAVNIPNASEEPIK